MRVLKSLFMNLNLCSPDSFTKWCSRQWGDYIYGSLIKIAFWEAYLSHNHEDEGIFKGLYQWKVIDVRLAVIPLTQLRFYIWIIPVSISFVQIHFWLVMNVTSYFIFSLQTDLIWSCILYMWSWLTIQKFMLGDCKRNCLAYHLRG